MEYILKRKHIKNMYARLDKDNNLVITAPYLVSLKNIEKFASDSFNTLIKRKANKKPKTLFNEEGKIKILGEYQNIDNLSELNAILLKGLKDYLNNNYLDLVKEMQIENIPLVKIKKVKNYLGQYNKKTNSISLNLLMGHQSEELIRYVLIHELAHTRYMNHQEGFWKEVSKYCPNYKIFRKECKKEFVYYENY